MFDFFPSLKSLININSPLFKFEVKANTRNSNNTENITHSNVSKNNSLRLEPGDKKLKRLKKY